MTKPTLADSDPFLAMIDARVAALQQLRSSYLAAKAAGAIGSSGDVPPLVPADPVPVGAVPAESVDAWPLAAGPVAVAPATTIAPAATIAPATAAAPPDDGRRRGSGIGAAVKRCLSAASLPQSVRDIGHYLRLQGVVSKAASMEATIASALHRLKQQGAANRTPRGWVLTGSDRAAADAVAEGAVAEGAAPEAVPVRRKAPRRPRPRRAPTEPAPDRQEGGLAWRIESLLKSHGQPVAARYVANATGEPVNVVGLALGRMVRQQRVEKQTDGRFAVVVPLAEPAESQPAEPAPETQPDGLTLG